MLFVVLLSDHVGHAERSQHRCDAIASLLSMRKLLMTLLDGMLIGQQKDITQCLLLALSCNYSCNLRMQQAGSLCPFYNRHWCFKRGRTSAFPLRSAASLTPTAGVPADFLTVSAVHSAVSQGLLHHAGGIEQSFSTDMFAVTNLWKCLLKR